MTKSIEELGKVQQEITQKMDFINENSHKRDERIAALRLDIIKLQDGKLDAKEFFTYKENTLQTYIEKS